VLTIYTTYFNNQSSAFYLQCMDFVWFAEQTAIISINSIKQLLLVILLVVFFEVRTECLIIINVIESASASRA
jgi:hypothetical protein